MKRKKTQTLSLPYRCEVCGFNGNAEIEPVWDVNERLAAVLQDHDAKRTEACAGLQVRLGEVA